MQKADIQRLYNTDERYKAVQALADDFADYLLDVGFFRSCLNCLNWVEPTERAPYLNHGCMLARQMPPPRVIVTGCEQHTDLIPF